MVEMIKQNAKKFSVRIVHAFSRITPTARESIRRVRIGTQKSLTYLFTTMEQQMIHPMQKGVELARVQTPDPSIIGDLDLRTLPKYICYKAALQKEKTTYQTICLVLLTLLASLFLYSRYEAYQYTSNLRKKEYILAPGTFDFTPVRAHRVSDKYVQQTVSEYLILLGNITSDAVEEQYTNLGRYMSKDLAARFGAESKEWIEKVKKENITETLQVSTKAVESDGEGKYRVSVQARRSIFSNNEFLSSEDELIEMQLKLVQPASEKKRNWYLEIVGLSRKKIKTDKQKK